jgi:hypothetical protein
MRLAEKLDWKGLTENHVKKTVVRSHHHNPAVLNPGKWPTYTLDTTQNLLG